MLGALLSRIWNRRKDHRRVAVCMVVRTVDAEGRPYELHSQDISESGIRLRFQKTGLAHFMGRREEVPLEIVLGEGVPPVEVLAQLIWAYDASNGSTVCGWRFCQFERRSRRRLLDFLDHAEAQASESGAGARSRGRDAEATV